MKPVRKNAMIACACLALAGALAFASIPLAAHAEGNLVKVGDTEYATLELALEHWQEGQTLTLLSDVTAEDMISVSGSRTLDLNGHVLRGNGTDSVIRVTSGGNFTLSDSAAGGKLTGGNSEYGGGVRVERATFHMTGGTITGNRSSWAGGGVYLGFDSAFTMTGGVIESNEAQVGGGVFVSEATATLDAVAVIRNNTAELNGGGFYLVGVDEMAMLLSIGTIEGNHAAYGGGISAYTKGEVRILGGTVKGNTADVGGGIYAHGGKVAGEESYVTLENATIENNTAAQGGGILLDSASEATFRGTATVWNNLNAGKQDNVSLTEEDRISVDAGFSGKLGFNLGNNMGLLQSAYQGAAEGLTADREGFSVRIVNGALRLTKGEIAGLSVASEPDKTTYSEGEDFDASGLTLSVLFADGHTEEVTDFTVENGTDLQPGATKVTVSYTKDGETVSVDVPITVEAAGDENPDSESYTGRLIAVIALASSFVVAFAVVGVVTHGFGGKR